MPEERVPKDMLLDGAQMSFSAFIAGTMGFLKQHNIEVKDWLAYIGEKFSEMLGGLEGRWAGEVMHHLLSLNILPWGAEVVSSELSDEKAEVTLLPLPSRPVLEKFGTTPQDLLRDFGVTPKEFESIYDMFGPAVASIGLRFSHHLKDGKQVLRLEKAPR